MTNLTVRDYRDAIAVQGACNLSGVVSSFNELLERIWKDAQEANQGTDFVNQHPLSVLYAAQIAYLTRYAMSPYNNEYYMALQIAYGVDQRGKVEDDPDYRQWYKAYLEVSPGREETASALPGQTDHAGVLDPVSNE